MSSTKAALAASVAARIQKKQEADREEADLAAKVRADSSSSSQKRTGGSDDEEVLEDASDAAAEEEDGEEYGEEVDEEEAAISALIEEEAPEERKERSASSTKRATNYLETELEEDEAQWSTERDEAAEAAEHEAALAGGGSASKKKRRLTKLSEAESHAPASFRLGVGGDDDDDDGFIVDDLGGGFDKDDDFGIKRDKKLMESIQLQKSFQPGATEQEQGGRKRFLAWNIVGSISSTEQDSSHTASAGLKVHTIEMVYADTSKMKSSKFRDFYHFRVAALGAHGAVFASATTWDKQDKKEIPSTVFFRPSDTWDTQSSSEWTIQMDLRAKEEAELVAIGDTWVAVGTNKQYVRIISHSGIQKFVLSLAGPCVTMVGYQSVCAIVFHDGIPLPGHQNLGLIVMDIVKQKEVYRGKCVISPRSKLTWIGYSDIGMLLCMDSFGVIRALARSWDWQWTPILDTNLLKKPGSTDNYWPVTMSNDSLMCVLLKNGSRMPPVQPRPMPQAITMQLPFLDVANENRVSLAEENHARSALLWYNDDLGGMSTVSRYYTSKQETAQDKLILGLFQKACSLDRSLRALDLCTMLYKKKAVEIAAQIATHAKKTALASRITMLLKVKFPAVAPGAAARRDDDEGLSSFLDGPAEPKSRRGTLRRPAVSFEDAEEENRSSLLDDGEAEYELGGASSGLKSSLKRKHDDDAPAASPLAGLASSLSSRNVTSANVKPKGPPAASQTPASQPGTNPFARKQ